MQDPKKIASAIKHLEIDPIQQTKLIAGFSNLEHNIRFNFKQKETESKSYLYEVLADIFLLNEDIPNALDREINDGICHTLANTIREY